MIKIDSPFLCLQLAIFIILLWLPGLIRLALRARHTILAYIVVMTFSLKIRRKKRLGTQNSLCSQISTRKIRTAKYSRVVSSTEKIYNLFSIQKVGNEGS